MKNIIINEYVVNLDCIPNITRETLAPFSDIISIGRTPDENSYYVAWGDPVFKTKCGIMETGFFYNAMHIDTIGLYASCSFNAPLSELSINNFKPERHAVDIILNNCAVPTKFPQVKNKMEWDGIVLALQNPSDRSIHRGSSTEDYFKFVDGACKYYGKHLFLKLHPWNNGIIEKRFREIASNYGCSIGRVDHSIIDKCKFVLVYNSTFAVDCFLRGKSVAHFAPGYFWQSKSVQYTAYQYPDDITTDINYGYKLCDFLIYRYLFNKNMPIEKWVNMLKLFSNSLQIFPMTDEFCYANNL